MSRRDPFTEHRRFIVQQILILDNLYKALDSADYFEIGPILDEIELIENAIEITYKQILGTTRLP